MCSVEPARFPSGPEGGNDDLGLFGGLIVSAVWSLIIYYVAISLRLPSEKVDEYVREGTGDPRALLAGARSFWRTGELLDAVDWLRRHNLRHRRRRDRAVRPRARRPAT